MPSSPKISIIVPVYNVEKYICRCLDSIREQSFSDFECILVDDGTPDESGKICDEYAEKDSRFRVIHKQNGGVSQARNVALDAAKGEFITFCDSDDFVEKNWLSEQYSDIESGDFDAVVCGFYGKGKPRRKVLNRISAKKASFGNDVFGGYSFLRLIRRRNVGTLRYDESILTLEDCDFFYRLFDNCEKILWTDKPLYHYVENPNSLTRVMGITENSKSGIEAINRIYEKETDKSIKRKLNFVKGVGRLALCTSHLIQGGDLKDEFYNEYRSFLKRRFIQLAFDSRITVKEKIILACLCCFNHPEQTPVFKHMINKRKRRLGLSD